MLCVPNAAAAQQGPESWLLRLPLPPVTLEEVAGGVTSLGPAASKPFAKVISEVSCSATMKPRETVLQSTTPLSRLLAPPAAQQAEVELSAADHLASGVGWPRPADGSVDEAVRGHHRRRAAAHRGEAIKGNAFHGATRRGGSLSTRFFPFASSVNFG